MSMQQNADSVFSGQAGILPWPVTCNTGKREQLFAALQCTPLTRCALGSWCPVVACFLHHKAKRFASWWRKRASALLWGF